MSDNYSVLEDQFEDHPDWIEIYNSGGETIHLGDYYLSDNYDMLDKWSFPAIDLPGNAYMVVFASGKDLLSTPSYWHTIINMGDNWKYYIPEENIGDSWKNSTEASLDWSIGKSGIGYADEDDSTTIENCISLYMQHTFNLSDLDALTNATLYMDYDDGFIAYLNGTEIARSASMGEAGAPCNFDTPAQNGHEALMYRGLPPESFYLDEYKSLFREGENILAIEVHNVSINSSDMSAIPFLLLAFKKSQEQFQSGNQYISLKNEYPHTNFKIASAGETIFLSDGTGLIADSIPEAAVPVNLSFGRSPSDLSKFGYFIMPTPGSENITPFAAGHIADSVDILISGEENDSTIVQMHCQNENDTIYYTTNGSEPDSSSKVYSSVLKIADTQVLRARIIRSGLLPGVITTRTIFKGRQHDLPRVSISTDPKNLWDFNTGIYASGPNAEPEWPFWGANFWQDWEKPVHIEIYDENDQLMINQDAGIQIYGGSTRCLSQKPFSLHARSKYGNGSFSYPLFKDKDIDEFETFILRNNGGDWNQGMFRDAISGHIAGRIDVDRQGYQPTVVYLNGTYWGIMNIREKLNEHFVASNHHVHTDDINMFQDNASLMHGDRTSYDALEDYVSTYDLENDDHYEHVKGIMDVDNFIRYWLMEVYLDNWDWPQHNIKFWSTQAPGSLFRWILYDTDFCYDLPGQSTYSFNTLKFSMGIASEHPWINADWSNLLFNALIENPEFRTSFINQMADRMNYDFLPENILPVVDSFKQQIRVEAPYHFERWGGSVNNWNNNLSRIRNFVNNRAFHMRKMIIDQFNLSTNSNITVEVSHPKGGKVRVNTIVPDKYPFKGIYFTDVPIQLEAIPAPGYKFSNWVGSNNSSSSKIDYNMHSEGSFTAVFEEVPNAEINIIINEINYFSAPEWNTEDWIELYNHSKVAVDLSNWIVSDKSSWDGYTIQPGTILPSGEYMVISKNRPDFKRFYPEKQHVLGDFGFGLSNTGDAVYLFEESGNLHDHVIYESELPWPTEANGTGATLELINPDHDNSLPESWIASAIYGTPSMKNSSLVDTEDRILIEPYSSSAKLYPSIFHDLTCIEYESSIGDQVHISVISMSGGVIDVLVNQNLPPGKHRINWIPSESGADPGMYIIRIATSETIHTLKAIYH